MNVIYDYCSSYKEELIWNNLQMEIALMLMCSVTMKLAPTLLQGCPMCLWICEKSFSEPNLKADLCGIVPGHSVALVKLHQYFLHSFKLLSQKPSCISVLHS
jgi:hypothetical protein